MYLLLDIGGTKTRIAYSTDGVSFGDPLVCDTRKNFTEAIAEYAQLAKAAAQGGEVRACAAGVRALDADKKTLRAQPHFPLWVGEPLHQELERALGAPVYLENDAALAGLGEATAGAGKGHDIIAYITVSTGVGGARVVNGNMDPSAFGFEPGNQILDMDGSSHHAGRVSAALESYISGTAFRERYQKEPHEVTNAGAWEEAARVLAYGLHNTIVHWSPDAVVLGGSMITGNPAIPLDRVEAHLTSIMKVFPQLPVIKKAELGDKGGLYGALAFVNQKLKIKMQN